jgi:hypothetical protein
MKIKHIILALCFSLILATAGCNKVKPEQESGDMGLDVLDTSVNFYHTNAFSKNKKQEIILAFWDNAPRPAEYESLGGGGCSTNITCNFTKSSFTVKFKCVGKFDLKTGKGTVDINGKIFDVSNGRLFLIDVYEKPLKVIQVNMQFNLPPFNDLSCLDDLSCLNKRSPNKNKRIVSKAFLSCKKKFEYLAKNNKIVTVFLADGRKNSEKNKSKEKKKKD